MKLACVPWLLALALVGVPGRASADPKDKTADASGRAHFQRGQRLSAAGDYVAAYREFAAGYAMTERPLFLFNMGEAARASGDLAKAREGYAAFLRADPFNALAATAQQRIDDLDRAAAQAPAGPQDELPLLPPALAPQASPIETAPPPVMLVDRAPEHRPIYKKWPFWAVVVGGAIAGGAIVYSVTREGELCANDCTRLNFR